MDRVPQFALPLSCRFIPMSSDPEHFLSLFRRRRLAGTGPTTIQRCRDISEPDVDFL
jgi:hypothetical protein